MVDFAEMKTQAHELLSAFQSPIDPDRPVASLSTAECQIVEIVKAISQNARLLVMDEPTSSLSQNEVDRLFETIASLKRRGLAVIYISHRLEEILKVADAITVLRDGRVVHSGSAGGMTISEIVRQMVGRQLSEYFPPRQVKVGAAAMRVVNLAGRGVSFELKRGQVVGVAGLMGSGRTRLAETLFGIRPQRGGHVEIDGRTVDIRSPVDAIKSGMVLLTEDRKRTGLCLNLPSLWNLTLASLVKLGMKYILYHGQEKAVATELARRLAIKWSDPATPASFLSGGNQQKLLIARWLLNAPDIFILDEPTRGIDIAAKRDVYDLINRLAAEGKSILLLSSDFEELFGMTDRLLVMRRGRLVGQYETRSVNQYDVMKLAAVGDDHE